MSKEAMKLALELFEQFGRDSRLKYEHQAIYKTIVALKEALAKQEQGEPVAWIRGSGLEMLKLENGGVATVYASEGMSNYSTPLYATPQPKQKQPPIGFITNARHRLNFEPNATGLKDMPKTVDWKIPVYTTPQQRKPLTRAEIINAVAVAFNFNSRDYDEIIEPVARAIEAAHGIKE